MDDRQQLLEAYGNAYHEIANLLSQYPRAMWSFKGAPDGWSIHELLVHLGDAEAVGYVRCRRIIAEPGKAVFAYNEEDWAHNLNYMAQSPETAFELFRLLRDLTYRLLKSVPESAWANTLDHPENGIMTLDDWLKSYVNHSKNHTTQMQDVFAAWQAQQQQAKQQ